MSGTGTTEIKWPAYSSQNPKKLRLLLQPFIHLPFWKEILVIILLVCIYTILIVFIPALFPVEPVFELRSQLWWPIDLFLLIGTGGAILNPGLASVGLLGGLLLLHRTHRSIRSGVHSWNVVFNILNVSLTLFVCIGVALLYSIHAPVFTIVEIMIFTAIAFVGSIALQLISTELYKRTGTSLISLNLILSFYVLLIESTFTDIEIILFILIVATGIFSLLFFRSRNVNVPIESGEPPRSEVLEQYPSVDFVWLQKLSIFLVFGVIIGTALWNLIIPFNVPVVVVLAVSFIIMIGLAELLYRLNLRLKFANEFDPYFLKRQMLRNYLTIRDVNPGSDTEKFFEEILRQSQRSGMIILLVVLISVGLFVSINLTTSWTTAKLLLLLPILLTFFTRHLHSFVASLFEIYSVSKQQGMSPMNANLMQRNLLRPAGNKAVELEMNEERMLRFIDNFFDLAEEIHLIEKGTSDEYSKFYKEIIDDPRVLILLKKLLKGSIIGTPIKTSDFHMPMTYERAWNIFMTTAKGALLQIFLIIFLCLLIVALLQQIFNISMSLENLLILILGITIPFIINELRDKNFQRAIRYLFSVFVQKTFKNFRD